MFRGANQEDMDDLREQVLMCLQAGATATGARLEVHSQPAYREMRHDIQLADLYQLHAESLGRSFGRDGKLVFTNFSSDIGNVSLVIPSIHPSWASTRATRSTISPNSRLPQSRLPPTGRSSTARSRWPGRRSMPRLGRSCATGCWPALARKLAGSYFLNTTMCWWTIFGTYERG